MTLKQKVIFIVIDGLNASVARETLGFVTAMVEKYRGKFLTIDCELPSLSRPLYECLLTGSLPVDSGIYNNDITALSTQQSLFHYVAQNGGTTAAAAYHWVSELYNRSPYLAARDRHTHDETLPIQHGIFYHRDHYPDCHLFLDAGYLIKTWQPDFTLIHSMNVDDAGHRAGVDSPHYRNSARNVDDILSNWLTQWLDEGYQVVITSDHGMNSDCSHRGTLVCEREVPVILLGRAFNDESYNQVKLRQRELCGTLLTLLGVPHDKPHCPELLKAW